MRRLRRSLAPCLEPGCPVLTRKKRCPEHEARYEARYARSREVYNDPRWHALRRRVVREEPFCQAPGCNNLTTDADHVVPIAEGGAPFDRANVQGLCKKHHSEKTAREVWHRK